MTSISVKKQIFSDSMKYILSHYVAQFFGFIISIAMKRFLGPTMVGVWNIVLLISAYCSFAGLGSSEVAFRDIPFLKGARQFEKAERLKNEVFTLTSLAAFFSAVMVIAYALFKRESLDHYLFIAMFYTAVWVIVQRIYEYYTTLLRANKEFTVISKVTIWAAFLNLVLTFALVRPFGLYGLFVASFVNTLFAFWFVKKRVPYHFQWMLSRTGFLGILKIGFPLLLLGLCAQTVSSIDRIMIAAYLGVTELGNYSIALMAGAYLLGMPNMFCVALYPRLQEKYGECPTAENIKNYFLNPIKVISVVIGVII
jgi:O-antigen/teichoic acid export membrane protein